MAGLKAPFPWYGGKSRSAHLIWSMPGDPKVYAEPFAGSLAVLLKRPPTAHRRPREMVVDIDHHIVNFWRAVKADPGAVAHHCDHPTFHADLTARHRWLREWGDLHRKRVPADPDYSDARATGWWVWGISLWIGGGWCQVSYDRRPMVQATGGGRGVSAIGQMPHIHGNPTGGAGVRSRERRDALVGHMAELAERPRDVIVLGGNWRQCLGPTPLMHTPTSPKPSESCSTRPTSPATARTTSTAPTLTEPATAWHAGRGNGRWSTGTPTASPTAATTGISTRRTDG